MMNAEIASEMIRSRTQAANKVAARLPRTLSLLTSGADWETSGTSGVAIRSNSTGLHATRVAEAIWFSPRSLGFLSDLCGQRLFPLRCKLLCKIRNYNFGQVFHAS